MRVESIYKQLIGGEWVAASNGATWEVLDPATEETVRTVPFGNADDCRAAIDAAQKAFPPWAARTPYERAEILCRAAGLMRTRAAELATVTVREAGKPLPEARG
ncbi:MAG: aldehyde dehydrogenase, partial [Candidatus Wallbacteria bacterium]|nr:aldehyde dehydrogenase [Candidatus Wallbacteria bacterium]